MEQRPGQIGIYVHIPFCEKKCFYCDFYSLENHSQRDAFIDALVREIALFSEVHPNLEADTIFFGGGTPSLLNPGELDRILSAITRTFKLASRTEFTIECNPGTVDTMYLREYRNLGANRLSFGVQSFFDDELKFLQRIHDSDQAVNAVRLARDAGFENINIDLIYALPGQTDERLAANLEKAVALCPDHISAYSLIVEPGTPLFAAVSKGEVLPSPESLEADMFERVMEFMERHGYRHYEISNYAKPGYECGHNLKYWNVEEYAGFGPSAHSYINGERWWNVSSLSGYVAELAKSMRPISARERLTSGQKLDEFVLLRLRQGRLDPSEIRERFGVIVDHEFVSGMTDGGYSYMEGGTMRLTRKGFTVCDEIAETFLARHSVPA